METSIIITHWSQNEFRSETMRRCLQSVFDTTPQSEVLVYDNGGSLEDSKWLVEQTNSGNIACYTRYRHNMHFYYARNDGLKRASGEYIVIMDNDILLEKGWLEDCIQWLKGTQGKFFATPIAPDPMNNVREGRWRGVENGWKLNTRAGSNIWVGHRDSFAEVGEFIQHTKAGSRWCDSMVCVGYLMGVMPEPKATDMALRKGYNFLDIIKNTTL